MKDPTQAPPKQPHIAEMWERARAVGADFRRMGEEESVDSLTWKPNEKSWSACEVVDHLRVTGDLYYPRIDSAIERARAQGRTEAVRFKPPWLIRWFQKNLTQESKRKFKAPKLFQPKTSRIGPEVFSEFLSQQESFIELIEEADSCNINRVKFGTPISPLFRMSIGSALWIMVTHQERHFAQAERVAREAQG